MLGGKDEKANWQTGSGMRMKRQGDRQVQEEDENVSWQTGSERGWKGKLTDRLEKRMTRQTDRQIRGRGWKGKVTDRFGKGMKGKLTDRLVNSMEKHIDKEAWVQDVKANWQTGCENDGQVEQQACEQDGDRRLKRMEGKLRDRLMSRNDGQIKRQACEKDGRQIKRHAMFRLVKKNGEANLAIFWFFFVLLRIVSLQVVLLYFVYIPFIFAFSFLLFHFNAKQTKIYIFSLQSTTKFSPWFRFSLQKQKRRRTLRCTALCCDADIAESTVMWQPKKMCR